MKWYRIIARSHVDGPGERTVLYMQGCSVKCPGCQSQHLWAKFTPETKESESMDLARALMNESKTGYITIQGGEPFDQPEALLVLVMGLRAYGATHIMAYSGYTFEHLTKSHPKRKVIRQIIRFLDILVDGPFMFKLDNPFLVWRGSTNQRPINIPATLKAKSLVVENWDKPRIVIPANGSGMLVPVGMVNQFAAAGSVGNTRRCGQSK